MSGRFLTNQQIRDREAAEQAVERKRERAKARRAKARADAKYLPELNRLEPIIQCVWQEFATARDLRNAKVVTVKRGDRYNHDGDYGFDLSAGHTWNLEVNFHLKLRLQAVRLAVTVPPRSGFFNKIPQDLAQVIADETSRDVTFFEWKRGYHDPEMGIQQPDGYEGVYSTQPQRQNAEEDST